MIQIVAIGDEVLTGRVTNTNASFISSHLTEKGWDVDRHLTLPDDPVALEKGLFEAIHNSRVVITTGGLGPTADDRTREIAASLFHSEFHYEPKIAADIAARFGDNLPSLKDQATIPSRATPLLNRIGTAPGFIFHEGGHILILLPGIPQEMRPMFVEQVIPFLEREVPPQKRFFTETFRLALLSENTVEPFIQQWISDHQKGASSYGLYPGYGELTVVFRTDDHTRLQVFSENMYEKFGKYLYSTHSGKISAALQHSMIERKKTLAIAESCTGGMIASQITAISGSSQYFLGSMVVYSDELKKTVLGVLPKTLETDGAVSAQTVLEMLHGLFRTTHADFGIAVSGIAGPNGGSKEKPVGTIWAAIGERGKHFEVATRHVKGSRETIILSTANRLIGSLWRYIEFGIPLVDSF